jgi:hypothetical protein
MDPNRRPRAKNALTPPFIQGEQMALAQLEERAASLAIDIAPGPGDPDDARPRAAQPTPSPGSSLRRSWSQESLEELGRLLKIDLSKPIDYRQFETVGRQSDDLFDDL